MTVISLSVCTSVNRLLKSESGTAGRSLGKCMQLQVSLIRSQDQSTKTTIKTDFYPPIILLNSVYYSLNEGESRMIGTAFASERIPEEK